jgi:transposase
VIKTKITIEEKALLKEYLRKSPMVLIRLKCHALLTREKGLPIKDIADILSRDRKTISHWIKEWEESGMASIFSGHKDNSNAGKLTPEQKGEVQKALADPPSAYGIPKEFWDVPAIKEYVRAKFDVVYESDRSYHFLLSFSNLSFKYPDTFDRRRDETLIAARMEEIHQEIKPFLENQDWEVFATDEVRMELEAFTRRAWLKRGERTIVKVNRKKESQSYIGLLNQKNFRCHLYELPWQNQKEILKTLEQFLKKYPKKKICIVWDNASFHKGKEIKKALGKGQLLERVHLINMPPYAPDKNPIEHVWNTTKGKMANIQYDNFEETKKVFLKNINSQKFKYQM